MLSGEELDELYGLDCQRLYSAELHRLPRLSMDEKLELIRAAQEGDSGARNALILNCLNWTYMKALEVVREREPQHCDVLDLAEHGTLKMFDAFETALSARDPVSYLMSAAVHEMRRYCTYHDPLIRRSRATGPKPDHPMTVSLEEGEYPFAERLAAPETTGPPKDYSALYHAMRRLTPAQKRAVVSFYGLYDSEPLSQTEIARREESNPATIGTRIHIARLVLKRELERDGSLDRHSSAGPGRGVRDDADVDEQHIQ